MDKFEYLIAVPAIILGLGITHIVGFVGNLLVLRRRVTIDWILLAWVVNVFLLHILSFYLLWGLRHIESWHLAQILIVTISICLVAVSARLIAPNFQTGDVTDLGEYFSDVRVPFFIVLTLIQGGQFFARIFLFGDEVMELETLCELAWMLAAITGLLTVNRYVHIALIVIWFITTGVWFNFAKIV